MFLVGLTGGIGTGKSTVAKIIVDHGIPVVDADLFARQALHKCKSPECTGAHLGFIVTEVVEPGKPAWKKIKEFFGDEVIKGPNGEIDRQRLGQIVFEDVDKRRKLNHIVHPEIYKEIFKLVIKYLLKGYPFIVLDLPLLFEHGAVLDYMHKITVVTCEKDQQIQRILKRDNADAQYATARINAQWPIEKKAELANFVIDNSGSPEETKVQVIKMIQILKDDKFHIRLRAYTVLGTSLVVAAICMFLFR